MPNSPHCLARLGEVSGPCMVPKPQLCSGWTMGLVPWASCLLPASFPFCLRPGALFFCFPWRGPVESPTGRRPPLLGPADTALSARLLDGHALRCSAGSEWEGALCPGWPVPPTPHHSLPLPLPHPWPWLQLISQLWSQPHWALQGVIWLPLVSERIIFSVDCPFL